MRITTDLATIRHAQIPEKDLDRMAKNIAEAVDAEIIRTLLEESDRAELHEFILNRLSLTTDTVCTVCQDGEYVNMTLPNLDAPNAHVGLRIHELDFTQQATWDKIGEWLSAPAKTI